MGRLDSSAFDELIGVNLTATELALLLSLPAIRPEIEALLNELRWEAGRDGVELTFLDIGELAGCVAFEARQTENREPKEHLQKLFHHLVDVMRGESVEELRHPATASEVPVYRRQRQPVAVIACS